MVGVRISTHYLLKLVGIKQLKLQESNLILISRFLFFFRFMEPKKIRNVLGAFNLKVPKHVIIAELSTEKHLHLFAFKATSSSSNSNSNGIHNNARKRKKNQQTTTCYVLYNIGIVIWSI